MLSKRPPPADSRTVRARFGFRAEKSPAGAHATRKLTHTPFAVVWQIGVAVSVPQTFFSAPWCKEALVARQPGVCLLQCGNASHCVATTLRGFLASWHRTRKPWSGATHAAGSSLCSLTLSAIALASTKANRRRSVTKHLTSCIFLQEKSTDFSTSQSQIVLPNVKLWSDSIRPRY